MPSERLLELMNLVIILKFTGLNLDSTYLFYFTFSDQIADLTSRVRETDANWKNRVNPQPIQPL